MLFKDKSLLSEFDIGQNLSDEHANLLSLAKQIQHITEILLSKMNDKELVEFRHYDNNGNQLCVDFVNVAEATWDRSVYEIKEILYRHDEKFSIAKNLKQFNIYEPDDKDEYKCYLQVLYFFYITNYFAFPKENIFLKLSNKNLSYKVSYDVGASNGKYLSFLISNLFDDTRTFHRFLFETKRISMILDNISHKIIDMTEDSLIKSNVFSGLVEELMKDIQVNPCEETIFDSLVISFNNYSSRAYISDVLKNLEEKNLFHFDYLEMPPFEKWKESYISIEEVDDFLKENEVYWFCKQKITKIESRDRIKFLESNAVKFLKELLDYDIDWIEDNGNKQDGMIIEVIDGKYYVYALKVVIVIKTYNDLINQKKIKIFDGVNNQPLRTALTIKINSNDSLPATVPIRLFMLACHSEYLNAINNREDYYKLFENRHLEPEKTVLHILNHAYSYNSYEETYHFLERILTRIQILIDVMLSDGL